MDVRCERCQTEYEVEDATVSDLGTEVQCSDCGHLFMVKRPDNATRQEGEGREAGGPEMGEWVIETATGRTHHLGDLTTLHKWIIERRVARMDRLSHRGEPWQALGDVAELKPFFDIVDSAERASAPEKSPSSAGPAPLAPPVLEASAAAMAKPEKQPMGAFPDAADPGETENIRIVPVKRHGLLKLFLTMLAAAVVAYIGIFLQQHRLRTTMISSAGTSEDGMPAKSSTVGIRVLPDPIPVQNSEATEETSASDTAPARGPVVEPIAEKGRADKTHLLGKVGGRSNPGKPVVARRAKSEQSPSAHTAAAAASTTKTNAPDAALAAQGYVALNHRQYAQAIALFKQALAGSPSNGTAIFGLAEAYRGSDKPGLALQSYRRYIQILPFGPDAGSARFQIRTLESKRR